MGIKDQQLLEQLKADQNDAYQLLYKSYFPAIKKYILQNSGSKEDAEDIFQETVIVLFNKLSENKLVLRCSVRTYIFAVSQNLWLKALRSSKYVAKYDESFWREIDERVAVREADDDTHEIQYKKIAGLMDLISYHCKRILDFLFFSNGTIDKLMISMGWRNKHTANNQKYKCMQQLKKAASEK